MNLAQELLQEIGEGESPAANAIARAAALRVDAVQKLIDSEGFDGNKLAQAVSTKKLSAIDDVMVALVGNDKARKKAIDNIKKVLSKM